MAIDTDPLMDPWGGHYFSLEIDKTEIAQFRECSGLKTSTEVFEIEEGGVVGYTHKRPGYPNWENVVLKRGVFASHAFDQWRDEFLEIPGDGWKEKKRSGAIVVRALNGDELRRYSMSACWPVSWEGPQLNSGGSDIAVETLEIAHEGIHVEDKPRAQAGGKTGGASGGRVSGDHSTVPDKMQENEGPRFNTVLFGMSLNQADNGGLIEMIVEDHVDMIGSCRVTITQHGMDWSKIKMGDEIEAAFGGSSDVLFTGRCTGFRHYQRHGGVEYVEVEALDPLIKLQASRHTRFWEDMKDHEIVNDVLSKANVDAGTVDSTSLKNKYVMQRSEPDLVFLRRLAARNGYQLTSDKDGKVSFQKPQFSGATIELGRSDLLAFDWTLNEQAFPNKLTVHGWDYVKKDVVAHTAGTGDIVKIGGGSDAISEGKIWKDEADISDVWVADQSAAQAMAVGELNRLARHYIHGWGAVKGRGDLRAGVKVKFKDFATGFNPEGYVVGTRHTIGHGMYRTEFYFVSNTKPK